MGLIDKYKKLAAFRVASIDILDDNGMGLTGTGEGGRRIRFETWGLGTAPKVGDIFSPDMEVKGSQWRGPSERLAKEFTETLEDGFPPIAGTYAETAAPPSPTAFQNVQDAACSLAEGWIDPCTVERPSLDGKPMLGLYLHGKSGTGKTTAAIHFARTYLVGLAYRAGIDIAMRPFDWKKPDTWRRLEEIENDWRELAGVKILSALEFSAGANKAARVARLAEYVEELAGWPLLLLDDLDKTRFSESVNSALFAVIKQRIEAEQITVITSNKTARELVKALDADHRDALFNRLARHFLPVRFA